MFEKADRDPSVVLTFVLKAMESPSRRTIRWWTLVQSIIRTIHNTMFNSHSALFSKVPGPNSRSGKYPKSRVAWRSWTSQHSIRSSTRCGIGLCDLWLIDFLVTGPFRSKFLKMVALESNVLIPWKQFAKWFQKTRTPNCEWTLVNRFWPIDSNDWQLVIANYKELLKNSLLS